MSRVLQTATARERGGKSLRAVTLYALMSLLAFVYVTPILFMLVGSLKPDARVLAEAGSWKAFWPSGLTLENYSDVFARVAFGRFLFNSLLITGCIVLAGLVVNSMAGYAFSRIQWRARTLCFAFVLGLLVLPLESIAVPLFYEVTLLGWRNTYTAQIVPFIANAFSIYLFVTFFNQLPKEFEESARIDGAGYFRTFLQIIVPNSKPVFASVTIITFLFFWGSYLWPLMVVIGPEVRPLPLAIAQFQTLPPIQWGDIMAFGVMMVTPVLLVFLVFQRWFIQGVASTGRKG